MDVQINSRAGDEIRFLDRLPPAFHSYRLRGASPIVTTAGFGDMAFQHVPGNGFDIWYSAYAITAPAILTGRADIPVLELHIPFRDRFLSRWGRYRTYADGRKAVRHELYALRPNGGELSARG